MTWRRFPTWAELKAAPEGDQTAYWQQLLGEWQANAEHQLAADLEFDMSEERLAWTDEAPELSRTHSHRHAYQLNLKEPDMKMSDAFPSKYLKCSDLQGRTVTATISHTEMESVGDDNKPVLYFKGKEKGLVLNKTNAGVIADMYGDDSDGWQGKGISLRPTRVDFQGKRVDAIRVEFIQPPAKAEPKAPLKTEMNDEIPW